MSNPTAKTTAQRAPRTARASAPQTARGNLTRPEISKLVIQAQEAFAYQTKLGMVDPGTKFDQWRRDQVLACVGLPGISKISRKHWRTVYAHFLTLAGKDAEAFAALTTTGSKRDSGPSSDNYETCEALVSRMREAINYHRGQPLLDGYDHIHPGWLLAAARQRTAKPTLTWETMAERLDPTTLVGLLAHLRNHIARREGRETDRRSKRRYPAPTDPGSMHEDTDSDPF